jgi:Holliday junction resolvase RusA-like endonuclease
MILDATVAIEPIPKARPRVARGHTYTPERTIQYEQEVGWLLKPKVTERNDRDDLRVRLTFRTKTRQRKDIDNLAKSVLDACNGVVWKDDQQVVDLHAVLVRESPDPGFDIQVEVATARGRSCKKCGAALTVVQQSYCSKGCYDSSQRRGIYRACAGCGQPVYRQAGKAQAKTVYCSPECHLAHGTKCRQCGGPVVGRASGTRSAFCSGECSDAWHRSRPVISKLGGACSECGRPVARKAGRCRACYLASRRA